jgi:hypothetical protein
MFLSRKPLIAKVARTSPGQQHHNTLVLRPDFPYSV